MNINKHTVLKIFSLFTTKQADSKTQLHINLLLTVNCTKPNNYKSMHSYVVYYRINTRIIISYQKISVIR